MVMDKSWDNVIKPVIGKIDGFSSLVAPYFDEEKGIRHYHVVNAILDKDKCVLSVLYARDPSEFVLRHDSIYAYKEFDYEDVAESAARSLNIPVVYEALDGTAREMRIIPNSEGNDRNQGGE